MDSRLLVCMLLCCWAQGTSIPELVKKCTCGEGREGEGRVPHPTLYIRIDFAGGGVGTGKGTTQETTARDIGSGHSSISGPGRDCKSTVCSYLIV